MRALGIVLLVVTAACGTEHTNPAERESVEAVDLPPPFAAGDARRILRLSPLGELPPDATNRWADDDRAAHLGRWLFFDERLSRDGTTSCATCHDPELSWTDGRQLAEGLLPLDRHTPSIWNGAYQRWYFWDGRSDSLWAQALIPLESPLEHAGSRLQFAHLVHGDVELLAAYESIFGALPDLDDEGRFPPVGRPVPKDDHAHKLAAEHARAASADGDEKASGGHTHGAGSHFYHPHQRAWDTMTPEDQDAVTEVFVNLGKALAAYERRVVSRRAPFDIFVEGLREGDDEKLSALDDSARRGLALFLGKARCHLCHDGPLFSDKEFHDLRVPPAEGGDANDPGRQRGIEVVRVDPFRGTGRWSDEPDGDARFKTGLLPQHQHSAREFKTPSLRNVAVTPPYMHQGQFATLEEVVRFYSTLEGAITDPPSREKILQPTDLSEAEQHDLVRFLESLTDVSLDPILLRRPSSPAGGTK